MSSHQRAQFFFHSIRLSLLGLISFSFLLFGQSVEANQKSKPSLPNFPSSHLVENQTWFWELIFSQYDSQHHVIHDVTYPHVIVDVIDFERLRDQDLKLSSWDDRKILNTYLQRYQKAMKIFANQGLKASLKGSMEKRVYDAYSVEDETLKHLLKGKADLRVQRGLKDHFSAAAQRAHRYLPHMEEVFRSHQLPIELTRLPFVESMFNLDARSKVGASGIWQFMPQTARRFMIVASDIDERNSPWKATRAAARLLAHNYSHLKSWPLAITAYNHGLFGMKRAVNQVGSHEMEKIIRLYQSPSFGFASRNFYSEFLAAQRIYRRDYAALRKDVTPVQVATLRIPKSVKVHQLLTKTPLTSEILQELNPCLSDAYFHRSSRRRLPKHYEIIVPKTLAYKVEKAFHRL